MNYQDRIKRINYICYEARDHFMDYVVVLHHRKKLIVAASFDIMYYYQFFILFTNVQRDEESAKLCEDKTSFRSLRLEPSPLEGPLHRTKLITEWFEPTVVHKGIYFHMPAKPVYSLNFNELIDKCFALEDTFPQPPATNGSPDT